MCDKVEKIVDTFKLLSPKNQDILLECACNTLDAENSAKKAVDCAQKSDNTEASK